MRIKEVTWRHRNDFHFITQCESCGYEYERRDGYADEYFCLHVVPGQACPKCGAVTRPPDQPGAQEASDG